MRRLPNRWLLLALGLASAILVPWLWHKSAADERPALRYAWEETLAHVDQQPARMLLFLGERAHTRNHGAWDFRWMCPSARHVWATIRFEFGARVADPQNPSLEEGADGYRALDLVDVAERLIQASKKPGDMAEKEINRVLSASQAQIIAARHAYVVAHRAELDSD